MVECRELFNFDETEKRGAVAKVGRTRSGKCVGCRVDAQDPRVLLGSPTYDVAHSDTSYTSRL